MRHAKKLDGKSLRYPPGTPQWVIRRDYWLQCAKDAEAQGKKRKAKRFRKKARDEFFKAGGYEAFI